MNMLQLYALVGVAVFLLALHGLMMSTDAIRRLIAVNLMGAGTFIVMVALAGRVSPPDPVLHALVVTGLVVAISATAFALRLITAQDSPP
jgi:multicomponent Na+:H+ antiporter subunit C